MMNMIWYVNNMMLAARKKIHGVRIVELTLMGLGGGGASVLISYLHSSPLCSPIPQNYTENYGTDLIKRQYAKAIFRIHLQTIN